MAFVKANRVQESSITIGTGNIVLGGIWDASFRTFASQMANGDTTQILILNTSSLGEWEIDEATYNSSTNELARTNVVSSSNANAAVTFTVGVKTVSMLPIASSMIVEDNDGNAAVTGALTVGSTVSATGATLTNTGASGVSLVLAGNGAISPNKTIRIKNGAFEVLNSAGTTAVVTIGDTGGGVFSAGIRAVGAITAGRYFAGNVPTTVTASSYSLSSTESFVIFNRPSGNVTVNLNSAIASEGRFLWFKTVQARSVITLLPVVALDGGSTSTILAATAGKWCLLTSDGSDWMIMAAN